MVVNKELSLRARVFQWFRDHPNEAYKRSCAKLYEVFKPKSEVEKNLLRGYKTEYVNETIDFFGQEKPLKQAGRKKAEANEFPHYNEMVKCPHCPGSFANEIMKFVGFRGRLEKGLHPKGGKIEVAILDPSGKKHSGEARPEPIVPVSQNRNLQNLQRLTKRSKAQLGHAYYIGILEYEVAVMTLIFTLRGMGHENIMVLMPRGHGKTYMEAWYNQIDLKWFRQNILLLSETSARLKVGNWIYIWALKNKYLKDPEKFARKSTYQHFELINGTRMDIYKYSNEEMVGEHDYKIRLDDTIKKKWQSRPTDNEKMITHFQSNINMIIRTGLEDFGTRKFEGDPLQHRMETIKDMIVIKMSPFKRCEHDNLNSQSTFNPCNACRDECLLAPEIHGFDDLMDKMEEDYESWYSEMMQDPHPKAGGMVEEEDIEYVNRPFFVDTVLCGIGVDVAENWDDSLLADMSAIITCVMSFEKDVKYRKRRKFTFLTEDVRRMPYRTAIDKKGRENRGIIETIDKAVKMFEKDYPNVSIIIAIERNGPGIVLIEQILRERWSWYRKIIADKGQAVKWIREGKANVPLGIKHLTEKVPRINSELRHSIKEKQTRFTINLEDTTFMTQLLSFPKGKHDDGPDAGGMIKDELNRRWTVSKERTPREDPALERIKKHAVERYKDLEAPWLKVQKQANRKVNKRATSRSPPPF